jgi:hypothetical protein
MKRALKFYAPRLKLPAHPVKTGQARRGLPGKEIFILIVPLDPA